MKGAGMNEVKVIDRVWRPNSQTEIRQLSYRDVLQDRSGTLKHIDRMGEIAGELGYPMFVWNERVYALKGSSWVDTTLLQEDVL